jgi:bifunctional DNA-binding transcriptional regulator/antitoxin component of YhaV-PrlF toxin-antitoxin module
MSKFNLYGITVINEKGQLVIPAEARHERQFLPGTKVAVMAMPHDFDGLMIVKVDEIEDVLEHVSHLDSHDRQKIKHGSVKKEEL